jgi:hypothetical protein
MHHYCFALTKQIHSVWCLQPAAHNRGTLRGLALITHDRTGSDTVLLTQELLVGMLGIRRAPVNLAIEMLKRRIY